jgi:hypothetical protein
MIGAPDSMYATMSALNEQIQIQNNLIQKGQGLFFNNVS